jgi:hypothetical protein
LIKETNSINKRKLVFLLGSILFIFLGPIILSEVYLKFRNYQKYGRWDLYDTVEITTVEGEKMKLTVPVMIDDWREPSPWEGILYYTIILGCPLIGGTGIWFVLHKKQ